MSRRILVVEDDSKTSASLELYLRHAGFEPQVARTGDEGLSRAQREQPDAVILDVMLPGLNGLEICRALRESASKVPIIILTARSTEDDKLRGLDLGADDYVTKPFSPRELVARVNAVLRRSDTTTRIADGDLAIDIDGHEVTLQGQSVTLTAAEFRLLTRLARSPNRVFKRDELIDDSEALDRTVDVHVKNLRRKIESDRANPKRIVTVVGVGYKYVPQR